MAFCTTIFQFYGEKLSKCDKYIDFLIYWQYGIYIRNAFYNKASSKRTKFVVGVIDISWHFKTFSCKEDFTYLLTWIKNPIQFAYVIIVNAHFNTTKGNFHTK